MNRNQKLGILIIIFIILFTIGLYRYIEDEQKTPFEKNVFELKHDKLDTAKVTDSRKHAQEVETNDEPLGPNEMMPEFPGGQIAFDEFLNRNLTYPTMAKENGIQGKVWIGFMVDKLGNISNVEVLKGIGGGCDEEAKRVVEMMPRWKPGTQDGKPVNVKFRFPINFTLQ